MPFSLCHRLALPLATVAWMLGARRSVTLANLAVAFPRLAHAERERIGRASLRNLITVFLEMLTIGHLDDSELARWFRVQNPELLDGIENGGGLLLSGHFGNWELLAVGAAAVTGRCFHVIVKRQRDFGQLERMRRSHGNYMIPIDEAARRASQLLRSGAIVAMLADQSAPRTDPVVDFFGIPTHTFGAPARLALRFRPRVITGYAVRTRDGGYNVTLQQISTEDLEDTPEGVRELTARYSATLEEIIRRHPEQWLWQHRKWKHSPDISY